MVFYPFPSHPPRPKVRSPAPLGAATRTRCRLLICNLHSILKDSGSGWTAIRGLAMRAARILPTRQTGFLARPSGNTRATGRAVLFGHEEDLAALFMRARVRPAVSHNLVQAGALTAIKSSKSWLAGSHVDFAREKLPASFRGSRTRLWHEITRARSEVEHCLHTADSKSREHGRPTA